MAHIAVLGLGNWGTAIGRLWLLEGHHVKGWTIEQEVYESITMDGINRKYLPQHSVEGMEVTMHLEEALDGVEIVVLAIPSSVILNVVDDVIPFLRPGHVLLDLAKGLAPGKRLISQAIHQALKEANCSNPMAVLTGPTIAPEAAGPNATSARAPSKGNRMQPSLNPALKIAAFKLSPPSVPIVFNPSTSPHARATTFLNAPQSSAPSGSEAG